MKTLEEKKLLVKMARMFNQPVDPELIESIRREEALSEAFFGQKKSILEESAVVQEETPSSPSSAPIQQKPAETNIVPAEDTLVQQTMNYLNTAAPKIINSNSPTDELELVKRTLTDLMHKIGTLSWGGGGTGIVRVIDADDFRRDSISDPKQFVTFRNGYFQMDFINPSEIVSNTSYVTSSTYQITANDYYIGVNVASSVTLTLPPSAQVFTGRKFYIKDESGNAGFPYRYIDVYPTAPDKIDNQDYVRMNINNGGLELIYHRNGWRVI